MIPGFERNLHPRVTSDYVYNAMTEQWMSLDDITERCGITISERHVISRRLNELVKDGLVIRHFDRAGAGHQQEYAAVRKSMFGNKVKE